MPSECNGTNANTECQNDSLTTQPSVSKENVSMSDVTQGSHLGNTTAVPEVESTVWVPYLSLFGLFVVSTTLSLSFISHWKRGKRRRRNIQDYLDHDIDLKRKRLYGMMRMPFDLDQVPSFSRSLDDSGNFRSMNVRHKLERQYSYDSISHEGRGVFKRGGFQRNESLASPIPSIHIDGQEFRDGENDGHSKGSCGSKIPCNHHCLVSCRFCWKGLRSELFTVLKSCIDDLQTIRDNEISTKNQYEAPGNLRWTESGSESIEQSTRGFKFNENNRNQWRYRSTGSEKEEEESFLFNGSLPGRHTRQKGNFLKGQKMARESNQNNFDPRNAFQDNDNRLTYSDSELFEPRPRQKAFDDSDNRRSQRLSGTINTEIPYFTSSRSHNDQRFVENQDKRNAQPYLGKTVSEIGASGDSHTAKISSLGTSSGEDIHVMPQIGSPYRGSVEPVEPSLSDRGTVYTIDCQSLTENRGGIINYGFQSDFSSYQADNEDSHPHFTDIMPSDIMNTYHQRSEHREYESTTTPNRWKSKRKKPLLKSLKHFDVMTSSHRHSSNQLSDKEMINLQNRHHGHSQDHRVDLSVIDVSYNHYSQSDLPHSSTQSEPSYSIHDVHV